MVSYSMSHCVSTILPRSTTRSSLRRVRAGTTSHSRPWWEMSIRLRRNGAGITRWRRGTDGSWPGVMGMALTGVSEDTGTGVSPSVRGLTVISGSLATEVTHDHRNRRDKAQHRHSPPEIKLALSAALVPGPLGFCALPHDRRRQTGTVQVAEEVVPAFHRATLPSIGARS